MSDEGVDIEGLYNGGEVRCAVVMVELPEWWSIISLPDDQDITTYVNIVVAATLRYVGFFRYTTEVELAILLTGDEELYNLNSTFRQQNKPTNVLSFPTEDINPDNMNVLQNNSTKVFLGDIAISYHRVYEESVEQVKTFKEHFTHIVVHAVLHLLGYDHENEEDAKRMESIEVAILSIFGFNNPYIVMPSDKHIYC